MADPVVTALREAATHRGFRLLASRVRTPGKGDYGKFGLTDPEGKPVLGVGKDGLGASAAEIEAFLRRSEMEFWKRSAAAPAQKSKKPKSAKAPPPALSPAPERSRRTKAPAKPPSPRSAAPAKERPKPKAKAAVPPLRFRLAKPSDGPALDRLLGMKDKGVAASRVAACHKAGGGVVVAERGEIIGCIACLPVPALHRPPAGRIATLFVADRHRREGIGTMLVEQAAALSAKAGCTTMEAMSDIEIRSAHGFFRKLDFDETSYRFSRTLKEKPKNDDARKPHSARQGPRPER